MAANYRAAWIRSAEAMANWNGALQLAIDWVKAEAADLGIQPLLIADTRPPALSHPPLKAFAQHYGMETPRNREGAPGRAVLAFIPGDSAFDLAMSAAGGASLVVIEAVDFPLRGWAAEVGAINLLAPNEPPPHLDPRVAEAVEQLHFYGNNAYGPAPDRRDATRVLSDLKQAGLLNVDETVCAVHAHGRSVFAARNLRELAEKVVRSAGS